jgi:hypothetical protein
VNAELRTQAKSGEFLRKYPSFKKDTAEDEKWVI